MPSQSKFAGMLACGAGAYAVSQAFTSVSAPRSMASAPQTAAGQVAPDALYSPCSSTVYAVSGVALALGASQAASKRRAKVRVKALAQGEEELAFQPGQMVTLLAPPAMAGKQGTIVGPDLGDTFKVQLQSGSVFSIATENINGGSAPVPSAAPVAAAAPVAYSAPAAVPAAAPAAGDDDELAFQPGERVTILAPPAMAGKQGTVVGPALGDTFAVQLDSGSIFNIATDNLNGGNGPARAAAPATAASVSYGMPAAAPAAATGADDELAFQPGERVTLLAPPAMAGKQGTIVGPSLGDTFAVQLDSGSIFNIAQQNINGGNGPAPAAAPAAAPAYAAPAASYAPAPVAAAPAQDGEEPEFAPGQRVVVVGPPAMAGKQGAIVGPALTNTFAVRFDSGSIFNIATENIKDAVMATA